MPISSSGVVLQASPIHEFSARRPVPAHLDRTGAIATDPKLLICDEPVSALDVSVQAQILNLLEDMKARYGLTMLFIAHDLSVVKNISDRRRVMYLGKICEVGSPDELYEAPAHPYTAALLLAIPVPDPSIRPEKPPAVNGRDPSPVAPPSGCRFRTRCPRTERCARGAPDPGHLPGHYVACHFPLEVGERRLATSPRPRTASYPHPCFGVSYPRISWVSNAVGLAAQLEVRVILTVSSNRRSWVTTRRVPS